MGQGSSRRSVASSFRHGLRRRRKLHMSHASELSATFNMLDVNLKYDLLNINSATEEQLMTLPGINRITARNIIEYRQAIGGFKKIEDLALVSGVGAAKLDLIRCEVCLTNRRNRTFNNNVINGVNGAGLSRSSSQCCCDSVESASTGGLSHSHLGGTKSMTLSYPYPSSAAATPMLSSKSGKSSSSRTPVDINAANVFQLMTVRGIDQALAANIVHFREKKGPFRSVDELARVRGINHRMLGELRLYLAVGSPDPLIASNAMNSSPPPSTKHNGVRSHLFSSRPRSMSIPPEAENTQPRLDTTDLFELLSSRSPRPVITEPFQFRRFGRPALRLATWNLSQFSVDKAENLGVIEVICRTVLEHGFTLIAMQELCDKVVLDKVCAELNNPCIRKVQEWENNRGTWECITSECVRKTPQGEEYVGFLYDTSRGIELTSSETIVAEAGMDSESEIKALWAMFKIDKSDFSALCLSLSHILPDLSILHMNDKIVANGNGNNEHAIESPVSKSLCRLISELENRAKDKNNLIVLGDFIIPPSDPVLDVLRERSFSPVLPQGSFTNTNMRNTSSAKFLDNIWVSKALRQALTGLHGIIVSGLSHLAIPHGWVWGGCASDHCPVWAEFYVSSTDNNADPPAVNGDIPVSAIAVAPIDA